MSALCRRLTILEQVAWDRRKREIVHDAFADVARERQWTPDRVEREVQAALDDFNRIEPQLRGKTLGEMLACLAAEIGIDSDELLAALEVSAAAGGTTLGRGRQPDARQVATWLREQNNGKRPGPHIDDPNHVCPRCIDRLNPPVLARAVWFLLLDHLVTGAPVAMPPNVAEIYQNDPQAYPADRCEGCDYLLPTRSELRPDGSYRHIARYLGECPVCGLDNHPDDEESAE